MAVATFASQDELVTALRELHRLGYGNDQISVLAKDHDAANRMASTEGATSATELQGVADVAYETEPKGRPELIGAGIGGVVGVVLGLTSIALPGFGAFLLAAGPIAIALHGLTVGTAGLGMGALLGAIMDEKVTEDHRDRYTAALESGEWLLSVHGDDGEIERAGNALKALAGGRVDTF